MSDLFKAREKTEKGEEWRTTINVEVDDEILEFSVRQLVDPEFWEVMSMVDLDELEDLQDSLDDEQVEELRELRNKDELSEEEEERFSELQEAAEEGVEIFDALSMETFKGIQTAAKYCLEPDEDDIQYALIERREDIADMYGDPDREKAEQYVQDHVIEPTIDNATDLTSVAIGVEAIGETLGDEGN